MRRKSLVNLLTRFFNYISMIKINYNGFEIEVDSIQDAKQIIQMGVTVAGDKKIHQKAYDLVESVNEHRANHPKKKRKKFHQAKWSNSEIDTLIETLEAGSGATSASYMPILNNTHSRGAIKQMAYKILNNKTFGMSEYCKQQTIEFNSRR